MIKLWRKLKINFFINMYVNRHQHNKNKIAYHLLKIALKVHILKPLII